MNKFREEVVTLVFGNLEFDGGPEEEPGVLPEKWLEWNEGIVAPLKPDLCGRAEMTYTVARPDATPDEAAAAERRFEAAESILGMKGYRGPVGEGLNPTGLFVRESTFAVRAVHKQLWRTPPTNLTLTLHGTDTPIAVSAFHMTPRSPTRREQETDELLALVDRTQEKNGGAACWLMGDCNEEPVPIGKAHPEADWSDPAITDLVFRNSRARKQPNGTWKSCTYLDQTMLDCGMHDPARYAAHAEHLKQKSALNATAGHASTGQGGRRRIDRFYMDAGTVQAVLAVNIIATDGVSDHHAVQVVLSKRKLVEALRRQLLPLKPWDLALPGALTT